MIWNYVKDDAQQGPVTEEDLEKLFRAGTIDASTLVWREGMAEWQPYSQAKGLGAGISSSPPTPSVAGDDHVACAECGRAFARDDVIRHGHAFICAGCKPVFLQKLKEGMALTGTLDYAGFGVRGGSIIMDAIILMCVSVPLNLAIGSVASKALGPFLSLPLSLAIGISYHTFFVGKFGATPGKMVNKLLVVNPDGSKVTYGKALGRYFAREWVTGCFTLCIGYLMVLWDDEKRALHDRICNTRVIRK
jgi:uncharacterized RDD family membrane protein YckC